MSREYVFFEWIRDSIPTEVVEKHPQGAPGGGEWVDVYIDSRSRPPPRTVGFREVANVDQKLEGAGRVHSDARSEVDPVDRAVEVQVHFVEPDFSGRCGGRRHMRVEGRA